MVGFSALQPWRLSWFLPCLFFATAITQADRAQAETRVALVIGNGSYIKAGKLANPRNDASDVAEALTRNGFETIVGLDLDKASMEETEIRFARAAREADVALVYYSGHAIQYAGVNYLLPIDADLKDATDLRRLSKVDDIVLDLEQAKQVRILILDSCRDNPLADELKRAIGAARSAAVERGLARIENPQGIIVAYSTQAGQTASDGQGRNSPYTAAFLKYIDTPDEIGVVFRKVISEVYQSTGTKQLPELSLSFGGEFYLKRRTASSTPIAAALPPAAPPVQPPRSDFIFADSDSRLLGSDDLSRLSREDLRIARNEIFARRGRYFESADLNARFTQFAWYSPTTWNPPLNPIEEENVAMLERAERSPPASPAGRTQSDFVFPNSSSRALTLDDLRGLSKDQLRIARNEIFARRGRYFEAPDLKARFARFSWYAPDNWNPQLNSIEAANVALIERLERSR